ncbi:hypothetical protein ACP70R_043793 [Stipagrostis hirtigluma subsp. patula]
MGRNLVMEGVVLGLVISMQVLGSVAGVRPPAMFVFGDSTLDVGNNNYLPGPDVSRANRPYYGVDFPGIPTGRFSNGYNTADYVAKTMGFVSSPPAYLSLAPSSGLLVLTARTSGVSYASGGAGILDSTNAGKTVPLSRQVQYFNATKARMVSALGSGAVNASLSRSVFLIGVGANDLFAFATASSAADQQSAAAALFADLISNYSATITELYTMGARKFAVINVGLVGCVPVVRVLDAAGACADGLNQLAAGFDAALRSLMASLAPTLPGLAYSLADSYGLTVDTFADPVASGYTDVAGACCGGGRLAAETDCLPNSTLCANRDQHVFWDRYHPSQRASLLTAKAFYDGPAQYTTPINFKQLAQTS